MRKLPINRASPNYDYEHTHYLVRLGTGSPHHVDYIVPGEQNPELAETFYRTMLENIITAAAKKTTSDILSLQLIERRAGTRRTNGRVRFYETSLSKVTIHMEPVMCS